MGPPHDLDTATGKRLMRRMIRCAGRAKRPEVVVLQLEDRGAPERAGRGVGRMAEVCGGGEELQALVASFGTMSKSHNELPLTAKG